MKRAILCGVLAASAWCPASCAGTAAAASASSEEAELIFPSLRRHSAKAALSQAAAVTQPVASVDAAPQDTADAAPAPNAASAAAAAAAPVVAAAAADLPSVPEPANIGPDGFPTLPEVSAMLGTASETMKSINAQASTLEKRVVQAQMEKAAKMARQKSIFENKLKAQEEQNRALVAANVQIAKEIGTLKEGNAAIRKHAHELQDANRVMRGELTALQQRLASAKDFVASALQSTDDSKAKELQVLTAKKGAHAAKKHHHTVLAALGEHNHLIIDSEDNGASDEDGPAEPAAQEVKKSTAEDSESDDDDEEDDEKAPSFLALAARVKQMAADTDLAVGDTASEQVLATAADPQDHTADVNPKDLLQVLQKGVEDLAKQERASEAQLRKLFLSEFQVGARRHAALTTQQQALNSTRSALTALQAKLKSAEAHLEDTKSRLGARLRGLGLFVQRLAHLALAPPAEVPRIMEALPTTVALPSSAPSRPAAPADFVQMPTV